MTPTTTHRLPLVEVPPGVLPNAATRSETYRLLVGIAIKEGLPPVLTDIARLPSSPIFINAVLLAKIEAVAKEYQISLPAAFAGLCAATVGKLEADMKQKIKAEKVVVKGWGGKTVLAGEDRPDQKKFHEKIRAGLAFNKVVLAEASTGVGKGRALMAAAIEVAQEGKKPVIVSAPTINVLSQLFFEFQELCKSSPVAKNTSLAIMPGRTEFIDDQKLKTLLRDSEMLNGDLADDIQAITAWVEGGAGHPEVEGDKEQNALAFTMRSMGISPAWLADDLRKLTEDFPVDDFLLSSDSDKENLASTLLKEYKARVAANAEIILCSHAMLAIAQKNQWNPAILPQPAVLIVDEAHQLEQTVAQFNAEQLSLFALRWRLLRMTRDKKLSAGSTAGKTAKKAKELINACRHVSDIHQGASEIRLHGETNTRQGHEHNKITQRIIELNKTIKSKALDNLEEIKDTRKALSAAALAIEKGVSHRQVHLLFSPTRNYPSIQAGIADMGPQLGHLWKSAEGGVVLASATLYTPDADGTMRSDYIRHLLALPMSRLYEVTPIESGYMYTIPTLHYPRPEKCENLSPPKVRPEDRKQQPTKEKDWLIAAGAEIANSPLSSAVGGTLILCTSYSQIDTLGKILKTTPGIQAKRIITQEPGKKFELTKGRFVAAHKKALRPVMLALGPAWTGLDLADKDASPEEDTLLTDLVILRTPIGLNRSTTRLAQIEIRGTDPIIKEALLFFKQGLGRLIRRNKVKDRHIWIMDGRLWRSWPHMERFTAAARSILGKYKKQEMF